jgi:uncharacterized protein YkwD
MLGNTGGTNRAKRIAATAVAVFVIALGLAMASAPSASALSNDEQSMFDLTNQSRSQNGLGPLQYDAALSNVARGWVAAMSASGTLSHNGNLANLVGSQVTGDWTRIGENVGYGGSPSGLETAFMNSPGHRANILGDFNRVGIATLRDANGTFWVVVDFVKGPALNTPPPVPQGSTIGNIDSVWRQPGSIGVFGWAIDPDTADPIQVHFYVDGAFAGQTKADVGRPDIAAVYPGYGGNHGYQMALNIPGGSHQICAYGINAAGSGTNTQLRCVGVYVADSPIGSLDVLKMQNNGIEVKGWSIDPDTTASTQVHFYIDGRWAGMGDANTVRTDIGNAMPGYGNNHGYDVSLGVGPGNHSICAYGINAAGTGTNTAIGCKYFVVSGDPKGGLDVVGSSKANTARVAGWAFDPDAMSATTAIHVYVDGGFGGVFQANKVRNDIGAAFPGAGNNHGYDFELNLSKGMHTVCTYAINAAGTGTNPQLGCRGVSVG